MDPLLRCTVHEVSLHLWWVVIPQHLPGACADKHNRQS